MSEQEEGQPARRPLLYVVLAVAAVLVTVALLVASRSTSAPVADPVATPTLVAPTRSASPTPSPSPSPSSSTAVPVPVPSGSTAAPTSAPTSTGPGPSISSGNPDGQPSVDPDNDAQNSEGTPEYAVRMYLYGSRAVNWQATSATEWVEEARPYMSDRLYRDKMKELAGVSLTDEPSWEQVVATRQWTRPQEIKVLTVNGTGNKLTVQATFRYETDTTSGKTMSDSPQIAQYTVISQAGRWVVDVEQEPAN